MFSYGYDKLTDAERLSIYTTPLGVVLMNLIDEEIAIVKDKLCSLSIGPDLILEYTITQQRLIALQDLKEFFEQVQKDAFNPPSE